MQILFGHSDKLAAIAASMIDIVGESGFGKCQALGVVTGLEETDKLEAICVYHEYHPAHKTSMVSFAAFSPRWAQKGIIRALLSVPFAQYGVKKLWCVTSIKNKRCQKLVKGLGFKQEAVLANHFGAKNHAVVFRMMEEDFVEKYGKYALQTT